ncbi:hypothetical protein Tco_0999557 [Tanacetum coccineum]
MLLVQNTLLTQEIMLNHLPKLLLDNLFMKLADSTTKAHLGKSIPKDSLSQQQGNDEGTTNFSYDHFIVGANPSVLLDKTKSARDRLGTIQPNTKTEKAPKTEQEFDTSFEFNTSSTTADDEEIKLEDLSKLVKDIGTEVMDLDSPEDDPPLMILSKDEEEIQTEVHDETKDTLVPPPPSLKSIQIQELTNQVLLLQSQKYKLEKAHAAAQAEATLSKAQPAFLNVQQLTELLVTSLKPKLLKLLTDHNFSSSIPTKLKELPSKINDIDGVVAEIKKYVEELEVEVPVLTSNVVALEKIKLDLPARLLALPKQISSINVQLSKLKVLDALPSLLNKVTEALDRFPTAIELASQKAGEISVPSAGQAGTHPSEGEKYTTQVTITQLFQRRNEKDAAKANLNKQPTIHETTTVIPPITTTTALMIPTTIVKVDVAKSKIKKGKQNLIDLVGLKVVEKMYRDKVKYEKYYLKMLNQRALGKITNYDVLSRGKEVMDASPKRTGVGWTTIYAQMRQRLDALRKAEAELELDLSKPLEEHDPIIKLNLLCNTPKMGHSGI